MVSGHEPFEATQDEGRVRPSRPEEHLDLAARLATMPAGTPTGVVLVGWDPPPTAAQELTHTSIEQVITFVLAACAEREDTLVAVGSRQIAVVRSPIEAPAATEGLSHRIAHQLDIELVRLATQTGDPATPWAIGVAVGTTPAPNAVLQLARRAERAVDDAWLLGGGQVVVSDHDLLLPTPRPRHGGPNPQPPGR